MLAFSRKAAGEIAQLKYLMVSTVLRLLYGAAFMCAVANETGRTIMDHSVKDCHISECSAGDSCLSLFTGCPANSKARHEFQRCTKCSHTLDMTVNEQIDINKRTVPLDTLA